MNELLHFRITELAELIRTRKLSVEEVVTTFIAQNERVNPQLNALVADRFEQAISDAKKADKSLKRRKNIPPLFGIPWTAKEMLSVLGMPNTAGSVHRRGVVANQDADVIKRIKSAGAINLGVSNQSELGLWHESNNPVYGRTNNPWDLRRTAGGSSGGEGALVSTAATGFGVGSDMGGSVRIPAFYCGIFGHKPGKDRVPANGHFPHDYSLARFPDPPTARYISIGPMTRDARDLLPLFNVFANATETPKDLKFKRAYFLEDPGIRLTSAPCPDQRRAVNLATAALSDHHMEVDEWDFLTFQNAMNVYTGTLLEGSTMGVQQVIGGGTPPRLRREIPNLFFKKGSHTAPALLLSFGERIIAPKPRAIQRLVLERDQMVERINHILKDDAVLILPTLAFPAPLHNGTMFRPFDIVYTAIFNALELPVTAVPMGLSAEGIPIGVQIVGAMGQDALTMSVAVALQESLGGWEKPLLIR